MKHVLRYLISGFLLMLTLASGAADTLKIHLTYKHKLDNTGHTTGRIVVNQKLHTQEGILFREINFDEITGQMAGYVFYFYQDGRLFTQEFYNQTDSLQYILKHEYDASGNEIRITKLVPGLEQMISNEKTVQEYNNNRKIIQQKKYYGRKLGAIAKYQYTPSGILSQEISKFKPSAKPSCKKENRSYSYSPANMISQIVVTGKDLANKPYQYREEYGYDDKGWLSVVKTLDASNALTGTKIYKYLMGGALNIYEEHNAAGNLTLLLEYEYKKHYMEPGTQVSRYETF